MSPKNHNYSRFLNWRLYYTHLMDHGSCQSIHYSGPDLIWLDAGSIRHSLRTHAIYCPHVASSKAHDVQVKDRLQCALDFFLWEGLEGWRSEEIHNSTEDSVSVGHIKPACFKCVALKNRILGRRTWYSPSPRPDARRNQCPAHWSDITLLESSLPLLS